MGGGSPCRALQHAVADVRANVCHARALRTGDQKEPRHACISVRVWSVALSRPARPSLSWTGGTALPAAELLDPPQDQRASAGRNKNIPLANT